MPPPDLGSVPRESVLWSLTAEIVATPKLIAADERVAWRRRNQSCFVARLGVTASGATVGELVFVASVDVVRDWTYKVVRRRDEVLRRDLTVPPSRHSNPPGRPPGFPGKVRALEHEHRWIDGLGMNCAVALDLDDSAKHDHRQGLERFCDRANIDFAARYEPPPPAGEQLQFGTS